MGTIRYRVALLLHRISDRSRAAAFRLSPITIDGSGLLRIPDEIPARRPPRGGAGEAKAR